MGLHGSLWIKYFLQTNFLFPINKDSMKRLIIIGTVFFALTLKAQVITTIPYFATESDSVVVIFNAAEGSQGLKDYSGDVYAHTGVVTNLSNSGWKYVIGSWGNNSTQPKLSYLGNNKFKLVIGYPRTFYNITNTNEKILQLAFVFRSSDNSKTGRDVGGADIFAQIYEGGLNVAIANPSQPYQFADMNDQIDILAVSKGSVSLDLYINSNLVESTSNDSISYSFQITETGKTWVTALARDAVGEEVSDSVYFVVRDDVITQELPEGVIDGINYIDQTTVTLVLFAPKKEFVYVIGDFNGWTVDPLYHMRRTPNDSTYWLTINNLSPGSEYGFQYFIDGELVIPDPYSDKILDPWNDKNISAQTYPNLLQYPAEKTTNIVSVLQTAQSQYQWRVENFQRPPKENLVIYELLVRDFVSTHSFKTLKDTLDYFVKLGVNAIELMPVNEFNGNESWGYNPMMYFAPDKFYGTKNDLKDFVDAAHERGIAVIFDIVLNHAYELNPFVRMYFDAANNKPSADNPWFNVNHNFTNTDAHWGYDFNHESKFTQQFVDRVTNYWLTEYKFDGYRFDFTKGFGNNIKTASDPWGSIYDADRIRLLKRMTDKIWEIDSSYYIIFEHLAENREEKELADYGIMLWGNLNHPYSEGTMGYNQSGKSNFGSISYKARTWNKPALIGYMESHDEERLMYKNLQYGNSFDWYNIKNLPVALNRIKLASVFFFTVPGPKMIWQFGELGYDVSIDYNGRTGNKPIRWYYYQDEDRLNLFKTMSALINLKLNYKTFSTDDFGVYASSAIKRIQLNHDDMNATILGNFDVTAGSIIPYFQSSGTWYDFFTGDSLIVSDTLAAIELGPGQFNIYTDKKLPAPEEGIATRLRDKEMNFPSSFSLHQNYPNPFNPETVISYELAFEGRVSLRIFDVLGREIAKLVDENKPAGMYRYNFNPSKFNLASGVYFYSIYTKSFASTKKMIYIK